MIKEITVGEFFQMKSDGKKFRLIDVREKEEWDAGHIPGAEWIALSRFPETYREVLGTNYNEVLVLQCKSGKRSMSACEFLQGEGFEELYNLEGGILAWEAWTAPDGK